MGFLSCLLGTFIRSAVPASKCSPVFSNFLHPSCPRCCTDGEDVAREHMRADTAPQLQKETSEKGSSFTAGGAYASRDDPQAQASQPTQGKTEERVVKVRDG